VPLHAFFLNATWSDAADLPSPEVSRTEVRQVTRTARFITLQVVMAVATFTLFAVTINLIPLLLERGIDYSTAALAFGLLGAGQVIGRLGYPPLASRTSPRLRMTIILGAGAAGLLALALLPGPAWLLIVVAIGAGAARGCHTLLQATAVSDRWRTQNCGASNAIFTAPMTTVTARAPVAGPALAGLLGGYSAMAIIMAVLLALATALSNRTC